MSKELLHTDSLSDVSVPEPIVPVPGRDNASAPVYRSLGWVYYIDNKLAWLIRATMFTAMILLGLRLLGSVICFVALIIFLKFGYDFASFNIQVNRKRTYMRLPKYLWDFSMIFGLGLMIFYMALQIFLEARALFTGKGGE